MTKTSTLLANCAQGASWRICRASWAVFRSRFWASQDLKRVFNNLAKRESNFYVGDAVFSRSTLVT